MKGETKIETCGFVFQLFKQLAIAVNIDTNGYIRIPFTRLLVYNYLYQFGEYEKLLNSEYTDNNTRCLINFLQENNAKERFIE